MTRRHEPDGVITPGQTNSHLNSLSRGVVALLSDASWPLPQRLRKKEKKGQRSEKEVVCSAVSEHRQLPGGRVLNAIRSCQLLHRHTADRKDTSLRSLTRIFDEIPTDSCCCCCCCCSYRHLQQQYLILMQFLFRRRRFAVGYQARGNQYPLF